MASTQAAPPARAAIECILGINATKSGRLQIWNVAIDCTCIPDASHTSILDGAGQARLEPIDPKHARDSRASFLAHPAFVTPGRGGKGVIFVNQGQDNERAGNATRRQERSHDYIHSGAAAIGHGE
jgi:hypothetical protein